MRAILNGSAKYNPPLRVVADILHNTVNRTCQEQKILTIKVEFKTVLIPAVFCQNVKITLVPNNFPMFITLKNRTISHDVIITYLFLGTHVESFAGNHC